MGVNSSHCDIHLDHRLFPSFRRTLAAMAGVRLEGGLLTHSGFQNESPHAQCPDLRFESGHEASPQACSTRWAPRTSV